MNNFLAFSSYFYVKTANIYSFFIKVAAFQVWFTDACALVTCLAIKKIIILKNNTMYKWNLQINDLNSFFQKNSRTSCIFLRATWPSRLYRDIYFLVVVPSCMNHRNSWFSTVGLKNFSTLSNIEHYWRKLRHRLHFQRNMDQWSFPTIRHTKRCSYVGEIIGPGFSVVHLVQFCLFAKPFNWKWTSSFSIKLWMKSKFSCALCRT